MHRTTPTPAVPAPAVRPQRLVFVDESFFEWFGCRRRDGNFCYAAVSLPASSTGDLGDFMSALEARILRAYAKATGKPLPKEVKSAHIRALPPGDLQTIAEKIAYFLTRHKGYIFGFFTTTEGLINNELRGDHYEKDANEFTTVKTNYEAEFQRVKDEMQKDWADRKAALEKSTGDNVHCFIELERLYHQFVGFAVHFHANSIRETFHIHYDSRNPVEDRLLHDSLEDFLAKLERTGVQARRYYLGADFVSSERSAGARLAVLIAGDFRQLFRTYPHLLDAESDLEVLSAKYNPAMTLVGGRAPFYRREDSGQVQELVRNFDPQKPLMFPILKQFLACGLISGYGANGEARHVDFQTGGFWDMAD